MGVRGVWTTWKVGKIRDMTLLNETEYRKRLVSKMTDQAVVTKAQYEDFFLDARMRQRGESVILNFPWGMQELYVVEK